MRYRNTDRHRNYKVNYTCQINRQEEFRRPLRDGSNRTTDKARQRNKDAETWKEGKIGRTEGEIRNKNEL